MSAIHRTGDRWRTRTLAWWSLGLAVLGTFGWFGILYALGQATT